MPSFKTKQEMVKHCKEQFIYYLKCIKDSTDWSYLNYYRGQVVAYDNMLANLGFDTKIDLKLEAWEE